MALVTIPNVEIEIEIPDVELQGTTLKRKAKLFTLTYNQNAKALTLTWIVSYYILDNNGGYGSLLEMPGISTYSKESIADDTTMVDVQTGAILLPNTDNNYAGDYIGQYSWFNMVAENSPLKVHDLIRAYGLQANWN
ncbi:MAG: hypothetical protein ABIN67_13820 [Ferruginibacter sp.]